jgi:hypothetical protein
MKLHTLTAFCTIASALIATAQVPSLINYQGRLTNANGDPVTGSKNFAISIYDAATNGTLLYTEIIGAVTLDDNGVYSFQFGGSGTSNTLVTETVATTDGTSTTFQKVLDNSPVEANSVSVTDGTYTWSQSAGSSNEDQFGGAYSTNLRRVTTNYYNDAPAAGRTITATYRYGTSGITGALASGAEHWMAVSVDGTVQGVRQRVLAVPFAMVASYAEGANDSVARLSAATSNEAVARYSGDNYTSISSSSLSVGNQFGDIVTNSYNGASGDYVPASPILVSAAYVGYYGAYFQTSPYGSITFYYSDGTNATLSWDGMLPDTESARLKKNPNPQKPVTRVSGNQYYEYWYAGSRTGNAMVFTLQTADNASIKFSAGKAATKIFVCPVINDIDEIINPLIKVYYSDQTTTTITPNTWYNIGSTKTISHLEFIGKPTGNKRFTLSGIRLLAW